MADNDKPATNTADKPFWCYGWHQQIFPYLCMHRYKKGMKKCEGCKKGKELIEQESANLKKENMRHGKSHDGD